MKIVVLSEPFAIQPVLNDLRGLGDIEVYSDTTTIELAVSRSEGAEIAILSGYVTPTTHELLDKLQSVKFIIVDSTGYDFIDVEYAKSKGIMVANVPGFSTEAVAEHAIALMFAVNKNLVVADTFLRKNAKEVEPDTKESNLLMGYDLRGKVMGVIGLGAIGQRVAEIAKGIGMNVFAYNRTPKDIDGVSMVEMGELLQQSDVISIHLALNSDTKYAIGKEQLSIMKKSAILINTGRGAHIDNKALYEALSKKQIRGAGLDVVEEWSMDNPLLQLDNVIFTPHTAWNTHESMGNIGTIILNEVRGYINKSLLNVL